MPRPAFQIELLVAGPPAQVWDRLWDLDRHTAAVPLTTVGAGSSPGLRQGARFTARTALGPFRIDDHMLVRSWDPPRHAVLDKVGRVLSGRIEVDLRAEGADTHLCWIQTFGAVGVPDTLAGWAARPVRAAYRRTLAQITRP
ncbi:hypothetical protein [Ornithinimicrobium pratense]|uniref:SRPBCC family protein n=1 Tax=Ornithinimicrobium pratense TaxID=2593973 RepID=A0A5J6V1Q0_9MICO|nr:hypothetical protein [Ornithinimicrobium pratense]QFG67545.1 hypothetical protein FY030_01330 [Ornithinimicrobium pratense]